MSVGRHTILNDDLADRLVKQVQAGVHLPTAARNVGIHPDSLRDWLGRGAYARETAMPMKIDFGLGMGPEIIDDGILPSERKYVALLQDLEAAEAFAEARLITLWSNAAAGDWRAAERLLAKRFGARWADKVEVDGQVFLAGSVSGMIGPGSMTKVGNESDVLGDTDRDAEILAAALEAGIVGGAAAGLVEEVPDAEVVDVLPADPEPAPDGVPADGPA